MFEEFNKIEFQTNLVLDKDFYELYDSATIEFQESSNYSEDDFKTEWEEIQDRSRSLLTKFWVEDYCGDEDFALMEDYDFSFHKAGGIYSERICCKEFIQIIIASISKTQNSDKWVFHFTAEGDSIGTEFFIVQNKVIVKESKKLLKHLMKTKLKPKSFHRSVEIDHLEWMGKMYKKGIFYNPYKYDKKGNLPQHYLKSVEPAVFLMDRGFDLNIRNKHDKTVLDCVLKVEIYFLDLKRLNETLPRFLIENGAKTSFEMAYPLHYFCRLGDLKNVKNFISEEVINHEDSFINDPPIVHSFKSGSTSILEFLIASGANPDYKYKSGTSILEQAYHNNISTAQLEILLKNGADVNAVSPKDWEDDSPMLFFYCRMTLSHVKLIIQAHPNIDALDSKNQNALFHASGSEKLKILQYLINQGINLSIVNKEGKSAYKFNYDLANEYTEGSEFYIMHIEAAKLIKNAIENKSN